MFARGTSEDILWLKLGNLSSRDKLVWKENKAKVFSIKTAYQVALRLHHPHAGEHSLATMDQKIWKRIWSINVPPKVRTFVWWACSHILLTKANLFHKKVPVDPLCSACGQADETMAHILWECPLARNVWVLVWGRIQKTNSSTTSFFLLTRQMMERLSKKEFETWTMVVWSLWNARNRMHFRQSQPHRIEILK